MKKSRKKKKKFTIADTVKITRDFMEETPVTYREIIVLLKKEWKSFQKRYRKNPLPTRVTVSGLCLIALLTTLGLSHQPHYLKVNTSALATLNHEKNPRKMKPWDFFYPAWKGVSPWFLIPTDAKSGNSVDRYRAQMLTLLSDPENRIGKDFIAPDFIRKRVAFWMLVHAKFSSRVHIVHDRNDPSIIYGYIDYRPMYRVYGISKTLEINQAKVEKKVVQGIRDRILAASGLSSSNILSSGETEMMRIFLSQHGSLGKEIALKRANLIRTQTGQRNAFIEGLRRSRKLLPHIESVLKLKFLPIELARIPFVESSFNNIAYSKVGAMGIWQFMPATARELIHPSNKKYWVDPVWQTRGAAKLLGNYRSVLPDWGTTITAYNSGVGRVRRILRKKNKDNIEGLLGYTDSEGGLGFAGRNFYAQFLSAVAVEAYHEKLFDSISHEEMGKVLRGVPLSNESCEL